MARCVLVAGTASHVGKSTVVTGLCRVLASAGVDVAPFKAQNMSNNAQVAVTPGGEWGEIGVSQYVQAMAAGVAPTTDINPVLLKPRGGGEAQLVVHGEPVGHVSSGEYFAEHWARARRGAVEAYDRLSRKYDVVVAEGAGSIAEINLHDRDLANIETARFADARVVVLADIERGGAFASLYGTLALVPEDVRERVVGVVITKFRGDESLLESGIRRLERETGVPVLGVVPYRDPGLPAEDSVGLPDAGDRQVLGADDGVEAGEAVVVGVLRLPRISNVMDFDPLAREPGVRVVFLPLTADLTGVDAVVLPGTKNTVDDVLALERAGFGDRLAGFDGPVVGICGGYQMLGEQIENAHIEGTTDQRTVPGFGLLPVRTRFERAKRVARVTRRIEGSGPFAGASGTVRGYEIHMGQTRATGPVDRPVGPQSAATGRVLGTYLHGVFDNENVRSAFLEHLWDGTRPPGVDQGDCGDPIERAANLVRDHVDLDRGFDGLVPD